MQHLRNPLPNLPALAAATPLGSLLGLQVLRPRCRLDRTRGGRGYAVPRRSRRPCRRDGCGELHRPPGAAGHPAVAIAAALRAVGDEVPSEAVGGRLLLVGGAGVSGGFG